MKFEKTVLPNGITVYSRHTNDPFVLAKIFVPVGNMHNVDPILCGTAHFLEHMVCNRSEEFPEPDSYSKFIGLNGGKSNAATSISWTEYWMSVPTQIFKKGFSGLVSRTFRPLLDVRDVANEATVISNERNRKSMWWPGENKLELYLKNEWRWIQPNPLRTIFGNDDDLSQISMYDLRMLHQSYFDPRTFVVIAGSFDFDFVIQQLSDLSGTPNISSSVFRQNSWVNQEFHEVPLSDTNRFTYMMGGISTKDTVDNIAGLKFLLDMLVNSIHGPLFEWLRNELGWSYGLSSSVSAGYTVLDPYWSMSFPVRTREQALHVREVIHERIVRAIQNESLIQAEATRINLADIFHYQRLLDVTNAAEYQLLHFGRIISEEEENVIADKVTNPDFLMRVYRKYFSPDVSGDILISPVGSVK